MYRAIAFVVFASLLGAAPASADLSYTFVEAYGLPFSQSPPVSLPVETLPRQSKTPAKIEGWGVGVDISYEIDEFWHAFARYNYVQSRDTDLLGTVRFTGESEVSQHALEIGPGLHVAMGDKTDVVVEFGLLYTRPKATFDGRLSTGLSPPNDTLTIDAEGDDNQFGIFGRAGVRRDVIDQLELAGYMVTRSVNLTDNRISWLFEGLYRPIRPLALSTSVEVGTDAEVTVRIGLRFYYDEFYVK